jgi:hypothetical protein
MARGAHPQGRQGATASAGVGYRPAVGRAPLAPMDKSLATACATAALHGILATPSRDDRGRATVILSAAGGLWVREVLVCDLPAALTEAKQLQEAATCAA